MLMVSGNKAKSHYQDSYSMSVDLFSLMAVQMFTDYSCQIVYLLANTQLQNKFLREVRFGDRQVPEPPTTTTTSTTTTTTVPETTTTSTTTTIPCGYLKVFK